jgi:hypothetical protein
VPGEPERVVSLAAETCRVEVHHVEDRRVAASSGLVVVLVEDAASGLGQAVSDRVGPRGGAGAPRLRSRAATRRQIRTVERRS